MQQRTVMLRRWRTWGAAHALRRVLGLSFPFLRSLGPPGLQCHLSSCVCFALQLTYSPEILNHHTNPYC